MKKILPLWILLAGCSSWNHKDFEKSIDLPSSQTISPEVVVDKSLMDKFEVEAVPTPMVKAEKKTKNKSPSDKAKDKKLVPKPIKESDVPSITVTPMGAPPKVLPVDYPPELISVNEQAKKVWDVYQPNHPVDEKMYLDIHYLGMTVGKIMLTNNGKKMINGKEVWHYHSRFKSAPFYRSIYELDDTVDTYVATQDFLSVRYSLIQRESKQNVDDLQLHDRDQLKTFWFYKQKKSDGKIKEKKTEKYIPYYSIDPFSVVFFYQGLPLKDNDLYEIPIINKDKILILRSEVEGREEIETSKGKRKAIRVHAVTKYTGDHIKSGDLYFWFSDDKKRVLLKASAKIKIGSVTADIVEN